MNNNDGMSHGNLPNPPDSPQQLGGYQPVSLAANVAPDETVASPGRRIAVTLATAFIAVALAGVGFWALSSDNDDPDVAANEGETTENENTDDGQNDGEGTGDGEASIATSLSFTELEGGPGGFNYFQSESVDGVYYVLSTAPGQKMPGEDATEEEWEQAFRPNTLYTFEESAGWTQTDIGDRFVSDLHVSNGAVYLLSTGSPTDENLSLGSVTGTDVSWSGVEGWGDQDANNVSLMSADSGLFMLATRWANADWEVAEATMKAAGYDMDVTMLVDISYDGISYIEKDPPSAECEVLLEQESELSARQEELWATADSGDLSDEEMEAIFEQDHAEWDELYSQLESNLCWGPQPCYDGHGFDSDSDYECVEPTDLDWSEVGFSPPEDWKPWNALYQVNGNSLTEVDFPASDDSYIWSADSDDSTITIFEETEPVDGEYAPTRWTSTDGVSWNSEIVSGDDVRYSYDNAWFEPSVGNVDFRIDWEAQEQIYAEQGDDFDYEDFAPPLQRRIDGGAWEAYPASEITGSDDDYIGDVFGVGFAVFANVYEGEPYNSSPRTYFTMDGETWEDTGIAGYSHVFSHGDGSAMLSFMDPGVFAEEVEAVEGGVVTPPTTIETEDGEVVEVAPPAVIGAEPGAKTFLVKPTN